MARTFIRQDAQIASTSTSLIGFVDNVAPAATMESGATNITDDLNNLRSMISYFNDLQTGNWYDPITAPTALETGTVRTIQALGEGLHAVEKKRVLRNVYSLVDVTVGAGNNFVILGTGQLPANTTAALGNVTTLGTVVAAHGGTFGTHSLAEVAGNNAINPKNLVQIVSGDSRDQILSSGRVVYGLLHAESGLADGGTITDTTTTRVQISFVRITADGDDLEAVPFADIENQEINYATRERVRLEDLNEVDFLNGAVVDIPASATVTRQVAYNNQGTTPVDLTTNATLDLEGAGLVWAIRDDAEAVLFRVIEGSAGGTSEIEFGADVDVFDNNAVSNDFSAGATINSGGTRPIAVGVTDGVISSTAGDLRILGTGELYLDDGNQAGSTWAQTDGIKLSDTTAEWDAFETAFGEVSLLSAITTAYSSQVRTRVNATLTANVTANNDVNGPGTAHNNTDVDLAPFDQVTFATDVDVYLNGELLRPTDDVVAGGTPADGDLQFTFNLSGTGARPDQLTVIVWGQ